MKFLLTVVHLIRILAFENHIASVDLTNVLVEKKKINYNSDLKLNFYN